MKVIKLLIVMVIVALMPAVASAAPGALAGSHHDFSGGTATTGSEAFTTGLCTFCHTPHKAISTLPLWNHTLSANASFAWDVTSTTAGTTYPSFANTYNGPTARCLSCHDGSVAVGDIAWFGEGKPTSILVGGEEMTTHKHGETDPMNVGFGGHMKGNHPVAMPYPFGGVGNTYNGVATGSAIITAEFQSAPLSPIRLFNDRGTGDIVAGAVAGKTGIECSSCHDPHNTQAVGDLFLRGTLGGNDTNYICLKCHIK